MMETSNGSGNRVRCAMHGCTKDTFAACACRNCKGNGPILCFDHFEGDICPLSQPVRESGVDHQVATLAPDPSALVHTSTSETTSAVDPAETHMPSKEDFLKKVLPMSTKITSILLTPARKAEYIQLLKDVELSLDCQTPPLTQCARW
jgi:hypothetical protein